MNDKNLMKKHMKLFEEKRNVNEQVEELLSTNALSTMSDFIDEKSNEYIELVSNGEVDAYKAGVGLIVKLVWDEGILTEALLNGNIVNEENIMNTAQIIAERSQPESQWMGTSQNDLREIIIEPYITPLVETIREENSQLVSDE